MSNSAVKPSREDETFQEQSLREVSRTFALTIPELPVKLSRVVSNAYLLCRIADTIEDDRDMAIADKKEFSDFFIDVVAGERSADEFSQRLTPLLSVSASMDEKKLVKNSPAVIRITHSFNKRQQNALRRCIAIMANGMTQYQQNDVHNGLKTQEDLDRYCYFVAGVVGEMLTELFCDYSPEIDQQHDKLMRLSKSFGQGLQMTNILKDIWDDRARNMCWLPQDIFHLYGEDLANLHPGTMSNGSKQAIGHLLGTARAHLDNALEYTLLIPAHETGIRHFCLWALGMAILTLRNINRHREFTSASQVKISRMNVRAVITLTNLLTRQDSMLRSLFDYYAKDLPHQPQVLLSD